MTNTKEFIKKIWMASPSAILTPKFTVRNVLLSLVVGIFLGYITLGFAFGFDSANTILKSLFDADFNNGMPNGGSYFVNKISAMVLVGLAVAVALKANILNIGVSGQMTFGAVVGYLILNSTNASSLTVFFVGLIVAMLVGALLATFVGLLKVYFKVNEVVSAIMINWLVVFFVKRYQTDPSSETVILKNTLYSSDSMYWTYAIVGAVIALLAVIVLWFTFTKTSFGFKSIASGQSEEAGHYAGYKQRVNKLSIFAISGALSGIAGFITFYIGRVDIPTNLSPYYLGFTGIAVALVAMNNFYAIIFSGILFAILDGPFQVFIIEGYKTDVVTIFASVVTYFVALINLWMYFRPIEICKRSIHKFRLRKLNRVGDK